MEDTNLLHHAISAAPIVTEENRAYFEATGQGSLLIKKCDGCSKVHFYPRAVCPYCQSTATQWLASSGKGSVYSYTVVSGKPSPYVLAYVTLDEGVTLLTQLTDVVASELKIGTRVEVQFALASDGSALPVFGTDNQMS